MMYIMEFIAEVLLIHVCMCVCLFAKAQYILIHQVLLEFNHFGDTEVLLTELNSAGTTLQHRGSEGSTMEEEFQV